MICQTVVGNKDFTTSTNMVVSSTHFPNKHVAKERGQHQMAQLFSQIEHIPINSALQLIYLKKFTTRCQQ